MAGSVVFSKQSDNEANDEPEVCPVADPSDQTLRSDKAEQYVDEELGEIKPCSLAARIAALLFVAPRPLSSEQLAEAANVKTESVERELIKVLERFDDDVHGFSLHNVSGAWQLRTHPGAGPSIQRLIPRSSRRLSRAAAETLAVVAYRQPVQRAEIETIRGVDALPTLKTLLDARLIRICGRGEAVGQPALYGTTEVFLEKFGLTDLAQLPSPRELSELMKEPGDVSDNASEDEPDVENDPLEGQEIPDVEPDDHPAAGE